VHDADAIQLDNVASAGCIAHNDSSNPYYFCG